MTVAGPMPWIRHYEYFETSQGRALWPVIPDPNPMPMLVLFPRLSALGCRFRAWTNK